MTIRLATNYPTQSMGRAIDYEAVKRNGFHDHDVLVIPLNHPKLSWVDIQEAKRIGAKLYGPRRANRIR